jgi:hypothetical protein
MKLGGRSKESAISTAINETPLIRKAEPAPIAEMTTPETAGPIIRAALNEVELSATAFDRSASPTSSRRRPRRDS